ncbi:MAG: kelch repeat-containing protein [Candidatus Binataceae bacterium]
MAVPANRRSHFRVYLLALVVVLAAAQPARSSPPAFFNGEVALGNEFYYLQFPDGTVFGYYYDEYYPWLYHFGLGWEWVDDANDGIAGVYFYDPGVQSFLYTNPSDYPFFYNFKAGSWWYYYTGTSNPRYFYDFGTQTVVASYNPSTALSGMAVQGPMASSSVTVNAVNPNTGANVTPALATTTTDNNGNLSVAIEPQTGPVRITVSGGSFNSEMNGATISSPSTISLLLASGSTNVSNLSVNPLSTFVDARTVGLLAAGGTTISTALSNATTQIENIYGLSTDPGRLTPTYSTTGTDAANLGLILGAIINEDQYLCSSTPGGLVTALASDIADGVFDGNGTSGSAVTYCGGSLPAIAGITDFQDALSGLNQLQNVTAAFAFGGAGNTLTTNGLADLALGTSGTGTVYPLAPLATINGAIPLAAPAAVSTFAASSPPMTLARSQATAVLLPNGLVLIEGGVGSTDTSIAIYDPSTNTFASSPPSMTTSHYGATSTLLPNGKVLISGGSGGRAATSATDLYDPSTNTFAASTPSMNGAREGAMATLLPNGKVLIAGGQNGHSTLASTELYDPAANTFAASTPSMNIARRNAAMVLLPNGKVLVAGGDDGSGTLSSTDLYDPVANSFAASPPSMNTTREVATATLLPNGLVLIAGGYDDEGNTLASTELYNPSTNNFASSTPSMITGRIAPTATLLPNGKVLIAGGQDSNGNSFASTELYDPVANTFAASTSMNGAREYATATLLPNGKVFIAGGTAYPTTLSSTELYTP